MAQEYVILGDGIAGATAAVTVRKRDPEGRVTVITDEPLPLYNRVATKDVAKGDKTAQKIMMHDLAFYEKQNITLRLATRVVELREKERRVSLQDGTKVSYDKLLLATGGTPVKLDIPGGDSQGIHTFWTLQDAERIQAAAKEADHGVVVGAGLLGIDLAVVFGVHGVDTKYLMRGDRWWRQGLSKEGSEIVERGLAKLGVECVFHEEPTKFNVNNGFVASCDARSGKTYPCETVGVAIGLRYNTDFLRGTRVKVGEGILTDEHMRTSVPDVFAAGDIAQYYDVGLDRVNQNGSWASAKKQGETAGINMTGGKDEFRIVDTYSIDHFDFMIMSVGSILGERHVEKRFDDGNYRRVVFSRDRPVGGVFVGDVTQAGTLRKIIASGQSFKGREDELIKWEIAKDLVPVAEALGKKAPDAS